LILKKINGFFEKYQINLKNRNICVCLSGGADSVALLCALCQLQKREEFFLSAVHVNHHIRDGEADRDELFCVSICENKKVKLYIENVYAVEESRKSGEGLEETARKLRYGVFEKLKESENIDFFLTAHHANDTAETVVFNILRGCGVTGLAGIPAVRGFYLRPLIECTREEILTFLSEKGESYVEDSTNKDEAYTRNYIRHTLFGDFSRVNPDFLSAILRLSESAKQDEDYFACELAKIDEETDLSVLHPSVSSRAICKRYSEISAGEGLSSVHVKQIILCLSSKEEKKCDLPFGIKAYVKDGRVTFSKSERFEKWDAGEKFPISLGETVLENGVLLKLSKEYVKIDKFSDFPLQIVLDGDKIKGNLYARKREQGDKIQCRGVRRSVSKELMNLKIPKHIRDAIPIICDDEGVVFVPYVGACDWVFAKEKVIFPLLLTVEMN